MSEADTIGGRLLSVRKRLNYLQPQMAKAVGMSTRGWQKIERNEALPSGETLLRLSEIGVDPGWILTGNGNGFNDPSRTSQSVFDERIIDKVGNAVIRTYKEAGIRLPEGLLVSEAVALYNALTVRVVDMSDMDEVEAELHSVEYALKKRLKEAASEPGTGKREAS